MSNYDQATQALHCKACGRTTPINRSSTTNPERMMLLAEAFALRHQECAIPPFPRTRVGHKFFDRHWRQEMNRLIPNVAPRPVGADHGHGISLV